MRRAIGTPGVLGALGALASSRVNRWVGLTGLPLPVSSIQDFIKDWLGLDPCASNPTAFVHNCDPTFDGIPVSGFGKNGPFSGLRDVRTPLDECIANTTQAFVDFYNTGKTTGLGEGLANIGVDVASERLAHKAYPPAGAAVSIFNLVKAVRDIPAWFKQEWQANRAYSDARGLCEAAYGKP